MNMNKQLSRQLKNLKVESTRVSPRKEWVSSQREQLLLQIRNTVTEERYVPIPTKIMQLFTVLFSSQKLLAMRGVFMVLLVIGLATGGLVASASPLPRDLLFNVKVAMVTVTGNTQAKGKLHLEEANYQTAELQKKLAAGDSETKDVEKQLKKIKKQVDSARKTLERAQQKDTASVTALAKDVSKETTVIAQSLKQVTTSVGDDSSAKEVIETRQQVFDAGIDALGVLSTLMEQNKSTTDVAEIESVFQEKIVFILTEAEAMKKDIASTQTIVSEVVTTSTQPVVSAPAVTPVVTATPVIEATVQESVEKDIQILTQGIQKTDEALEELKALLGDNQVIQAVEALKQLNTITKENEAVLFTVKQGIKVVAPPTVVSSTPSALEGSTTDGPATTEQNTATQATSL